MTRATRWLLLVICLVGVGLPRAWSDDASPAAGAPDQVDQIMGRYNLHPAFAKLGRGVSNALGGWLEIPLNVQKYHSSQDSAGSWFTGLAYGCFKGLVRTGVGVYETVTFFLPYPENFAPILPTLEYFRKDPTRQALPFEY